MAPVLQHLDPQRQFLLETDALDVAIGAILLQPIRSGLGSPPRVYLPQMHISE